MKIEIRKNCKVCGEKIIEKRYRTYCHKRCRNRYHYLKRFKYHKEYQTKKRDLIALEPSTRKIQCLICGKWYVQVGSHITRRHHMTCRQYREEFDLEVKRGIVPAWFRQLKGEIALENGTFKNLVIGKKYWFKPGDLQAGRYQRSHITLERLRGLHKFRKYI